MLINYISKGNLAPYGAARLQPFFSYVAVVLYLLFSILEINPCYAYDDSDEISDPAEIVGIYQAKFMDVYLHSMFAKIDENVFRLIIYAPEKCGNPTFTLFDKKGGSPYENQDAQLKSSPENDDKIRWVSTNTIRNTVNTVHPEFYSATFDGNSRDPRCGTMDVDVSNIEINPYVLPKGDGNKKFTIKNTHHQEIQITNIRNTEGKQRYVALLGLLGPINFPPGKTLSFELQPGICPAGSAKEVRVAYDFSGKNMVTGSSVVFSIMVEISCIRELERAIRARDEALKIAQQEKIAKEEALRTVEMKIIATINDEHISCETACKEAEIQLRIKTREEDRKQCNARIDAEHINCETACKEAEIQLRSNIREEDRAKCNAKIGGVLKTVEPEKAQKKKEL